MTEKGWELVGAAERKSSRTCERCGRAGRQSSRGYIATLCWWDWRAERINRAIYDSGIRKQRKEESEQKVTSEYEYEMLDVLGEMLDKFPFVPGQEAYVRWNTAYMELHSKVYVSEDACCVEPCCDGDMCF